MSGSPNDEIDQLRSDLSEYFDRIEEYIEEQPQRNRLARVERVQLAVALAIVTGYLTLHAYSGIRFSGGPIMCLVGRSGFHCAASFQALYAGIFITGKLTIMSVRPIYEDDYPTIEFIDEYILIASYLPLLPFSLFAGYGLLTGPKWGFTLFIEIYIGIEVLFVYVLGRRYARDYKTTMEQCGPTQQNTSCLLHQIVVATLLD